MFRHLIAAMVLTLLLPCSAQELPATIRIVVPFSPGGGGDVIARLAAQSMQEALGKVVIVDNRPGAGGVVAIQAINQSRPNGEMLVAGGPWQGVLPYLFSGISIQTLEQLIPVKSLPQAPNVLVVRADSPIHDLHDLQRAAKSGSLTYASAGAATPGHLAIELVNGREGARFVHVPYKGSSAAITDVLSGHVDFGALSYSSVNQMIKEGRLRPIGVLAPDSSSLLPGVPSVSEIGYGDVESVSQFALYARAGTPQVVVDQLAAALRTMDDEPGFSSTLKRLGYEPWNATPEQIRQALTREYETWGPVIRRLGIQSN